TQDPLLAVKSLRKQRREGMTNLSTSWVLPSGSKICYADYDKSFAYYTKAAAQGNADAQNKLGLMHAAGKGTMKDYEEAVKWLTMAAGQRHPEALYNLACMYHEGKGVKADLKKAVRLFKLAMKAYG
ncbi:MAG: sel1 repeat family protein, partial [Geovibrio sp.]|nr:sel1 repeat family protein [Geovibrio sp.]